MDGYLAEYRARGVCAGSIGHTTSVLERWGRWMRTRRPRPPLERVDAELITRFIEARTSFRAKATVSGTLSVMRGMGDYLVREGVWTSNPMRWMKGPKLSPYSRLPRRLGRADMEALWRAAADSRGAYSQHLWLTVLALLYGTGLRRGELERADLDGWERVVPVPDLTRRCLEAYLPLRHNQLERAKRLDERALLVGRDGSRLTATSISNAVRRLSEAAGVRLVSVHQFRHSCASDLLEAGVALPDVQRILGHQVIATTVRYTHIADPMRAAAIDQHPINGWLQPEGA
jgi:site-specific recombinase XerD